MYAKNKKLDPRIPVPLYVQLRKQLEDLILSGNQGLDYLPKEEDLCKLYNVSRATVGKAVSQLVREGLVYRIKRKGTFISRQKFRPGRNRHPAKQIGIVFPITDRWEKALCAIYKRAKENGYYPRIASYYWYSLEDELRLLDEFKHTVDGIILYPNGAGSDRTFIQKLQAENIPLVLFDLFYPEIQSNYVGTDNVSAAFELTAHLINHNRKRIAFVTDRLALSSQRQRLEGYQKALASKKIVPDPALIMEYKDSIRDITSLTSVPAEIFAQMKDFIRTRKPDAVFCGRYDFAVAIMKVAREMSLKVPEEMMIATFDFFAEEALIPPNIAVIRQNQEALGAQAADLLVSSIEGKPKTCRQVLVPADMLIQNPHKEAGLPRAYTL